MGEVSVACGMYVRRRENGLCIVGASRAHWEVPEPGQSSTTLLLLLLLHFVFEVRVCVCVCVFILGVRCKVVDRAVVFLVGSQYR